MRPAFRETYEQILRQQLPNFFRLYLNPYVTQTCLSLERYVQSTWKDRIGGRVPFQSFLANSFDEALSGAIKLVRYGAAADQRVKKGLIIDAADRLGPFAAADAGGGRVEFVPGLVLAGKDGRTLRDCVHSDSRYSLLVLVAPVDESQASDLDVLIRRDRPAVITCVPRGSLAAIRGATTGVLRTVPPDIVIFDESFVNHEVPFSAFTARKALYDRWNKPSTAMFHSTTFQPNTISSLHFMRCLADADAKFYEGISEELERIVRDRPFRAAQFGRLYSPFLLRAIQRTGCADDEVRAAGDFVLVDDVPLFDGVAGVACSVRGHNPPTYAEEMESQGPLGDCKAELEVRLRDVTGLDCMLPAVSGASAVEAALKIALVAQFPRRRVLALKAGFGGKTLFALTATWSSSYKANIDPLFPDVLYIDPFAPGAIRQIEAALAGPAVAVVHMELIQAVGGVRRVPEDVVRFLEEGRKRWGYLLLIDEVQTGVYRTGPFSMSCALGLSPDLLVTGKAISDMMFPFALVLYTPAIQAKLNQIKSDLPDAIRRRHDYEFGYRTALNVLRRAESLHLPHRVAEASALFAKLLMDGLRGCPAVREVRVYGLLIGIELNATRWPQRWFRKHLFKLYLASMLRHRPYPVLVGFCQCEPNVLKVTPALTVTPAVVRNVCATIIEVLKRPFPRVLAEALWHGPIRFSGLRRRKHERRNSRRPDHVNIPADEPVAY